MNKLNDYEADPRPFAECLRDFGGRVHGRVYGSRRRAAEELRVHEDTLAGWMAGRPCPQEAAIRRLMTYIARDRE